MAPHIGAQAYPLIPYNRVCCVGCVPRLVRGVACCVISCTDYRVRVFVHEKKGKTRRMLLTRFPVLPVYETHSATLLKTPPRATPRAGERSKYSKIPTP